jgi:hypothetical protein
MSSLEFAPQAVHSMALGMTYATQAEPDFGRARAALEDSEYFSVQEHDALRVALFGGRVMNELAIIDIRQGLYRYQRGTISDEEALAHAYNGTEYVAFACNALVSTLDENQKELQDTGQKQGVHSLIAGTMCSWFCGIQTTQLLDGTIGPDKRASDEAAAAQWMLGQRGAWLHAQIGESHFWSCVIPYIGLRAERINGGPVHALKGLKWAIVRGYPELSASKNSLPPESRDHILAVTRHLVRESVSRQGAIDAALDYQRFFVSDLRPVAA